MNDDEIVDEVLARGFVDEVDEVGDVILGQIADFIGQYIAFPSPHCLTAVTLWAAHTHAAKEFYVTPRLIFTSAEPGSGKTRALELLAHFVYRPKLTISTTAAALYRRLVEDVHTILFDEVDALFGKHASPQSEDLRALLNSGYKRGATVDRCVGEGAKMVVKEFPVFAPAALAGLAGNLPATVLTRSVVIPMRKRAPGERVEPYRERDAEQAAEPLRNYLVEWAERYAKDMGAARPTMPAGVVDRPAEVWEALLAVADKAGGEWPERARAACRYFVLGPNRSEMSLGVRLLRDIRDVLAGADRMKTTDLLAKLHAIEEAPWADLYGKPLDANRLSRELGRYDVRPVAFKDTNDKTVKGYTTYSVTTKDATSVGLMDAWRRYVAVSGNDGNAGNSAGQAPDGQLPPLPAPVTAVTGDNALTREVTPVTRVTGNPGVRVRLARRGGRTEVPDNVVYVGRPGYGLAGSKFANPHRIAKPCLDPACAGRIHDRAESLRLYREGTLPALAEDARRELVGRALGCWCPLDLPCHADLLLAVANGGTA